MKLAEKLLSMVEASDDLAKLYANLNKLVSHKELNFKQVSKDFSSKFDSKYKESDFNDLLLDNLRNHTSIPQSKISQRDEDEYRDNVDKVDIDVIRIFELLIRLDNSYDSFNPNKKDSIRRLSSDIAELNSLISYKANYVNMTDSLYKNLAELDYMLSKKYK